MLYSDKKNAGLLLIIGGILCVLGIIIAETLYPNYSTSKNYISDLGVGPSALIFNFSVFLLGLLAVCSAYFIHKAFKSMLFSTLTTIAGIGAMGVGLFTEHVAILHTVFSLLTFLFGGISAIVSYKIQKPPLSFLSMILGLVSLVALVLFVSDVYLGLGVGGMERLIAYPILHWVIGFGGYLIGSEDHK